MGLIDKILSLFGGGGSQSSDTSRASTPDEAAEAAEAAEETVAEETAEPEAEEAEAEEEEEGGDDVPTKDVAAMADPRRREGEENTVRNRAENPPDHAAAEEAEAEEDEAEAEEEDEGGDDMSTKSVAEMADPRRREGEENTVRNRAENPADHAAEEDEAEAEEEESEAEEDDEGGDDMSTKAVAEMADPRRREGEENTVRNRAENPDDQRAT
ncbi:hypothetical protein [Haloplanus aerogenes]|uniref:X-linked retinitis pigmentosa GTPase regulator n=1 Tax=Haloplanus aerogenes TaxID=660522 RepID=A0A3M0CX67_9EURY|nr:hypothetical protein [Haloplanus aerogenes]AZH25034.1 hypothetical protein DU502_06450 [Haloplanus aerogenes]RMB13748.1 X-linked retinitis pigmentosa GTPase regulator [Haloplanus aerogenes]